MALIWGIPYLFIKIAVTELSPASLVLFRTAIGTVLLLPLAAARKDLAPVLKQWKWILVYTAAEVAAPWLLLSDAEQRISSSLAGLLLAATPSFGAILAWATGGHDRLDRRRVIGLAIGFVGVGALVGLDIRTNVITYLNPAVALALGIAVLGEPLTLGILIGFVLIVLGSVLATRPGAAPPTSVPVTEERTRLVRSSQ